MWKQNIRSPRLRVILESSWRSAPAAALRGLANVGSPACSRSWFSVANRDLERYTSPRTSISLGQIFPLSRSGTSPIVRRLAVTSSPSMPLPRVVPTVSRPSA